MPVSDVTPKILAVHQQLRNTGLENLFHPGNTGLHQNLPFQPGGMKMFLSQINRFPLVALISENGQGSSVYAIEFIPPRILSKLCH